MRILRPATGAAALVLAACTTLTATSAAHATAVDLACTSTIAPQYTPGLTLTPAAVTLNGPGTLDSCVGKPGVTSGTIAAQGSSDSFSCTAGSLKVEGDISWNDKTTSHFTFTALRVLQTNGSLVSVNSGTITSGPFTGDTITASYTLSNLPSACALPGGVTTATGTGVYTLSN